MTAAEPPADHYGARPWRPAYPPTVPARPLVPDMPLSRLLFDAAAQFPGNRALAFGAKSLRYDELRTAVDRFAAGLVRAKCAGPGDRVVLALPNCLEQVIALYALWRLGAIAVPMNPLSGEDELRHVMRDSAAVAAVCSTQSRIAIEAVRRETDVRTTVVVDGPVRTNAAAMIGVEGTVAFDALVRLGVQGLRAAELHVGAQFSVDPGAVALLAYTAGRTGPPRGAMLTHRNLVASCYQFGWMFPYLQAGREVIVGVLPLFQIYGMSLGLNLAVLLGSTLVLVPGSGPEQLARAIAENRASLFPGVPPMFRALLDDSRSVGAFAPLRASIAVGMALAEETATAFEQRSTAPVAAGYGLTEASGLTHLNPLAGNRRPGTIGVPLPMTEAVVVDPRRPQLRVPVGQVGVLAVRGPQLFAGYWRTAPDPDVRTPDGFWITGDLARMDADGFFTLVDGTVSAQVATKRPAPKNTPARKPAVKKAPAKNAVPTKAVPTKAVPTKAVPTKAVPTRTAAEKSGAVAARVRKTTSDPPAGRPARAPRKRPPA